jgi:hypothetical protein|tara:strand:- start:225 stop:5354 length:5130 start_codon:yes stop_codon:yes gene_type:complete
MRLALPKSFDLRGGVGEYMGARGGNGIQCLAVVVLFLLSTLMHGYAPLSEPRLNQSNQPLEVPTALGQSNIVSIGSYPDGANSKIKIGVPDGEALDTLHLNIDSAPLVSSTGFSITESSDFSTNTIYDGVDVNGSSLTILPQGWEWDFENSNHGWTLGTPAWLWGHDSVLGPTAGVNSGTKAIYTYDGNYPNGMSSTIWATSPVMNCSSCSGSWDLSFMKRLGVESNSYDHAYVAVKGPTGSWSNVYSSGYVSDSSFSLQTISISNYVLNNPAFQVRFGIGTTDGSVTYTGWNVDDVSVMPSGTGVSSGEGNWTSAPFSPSSLGQGEMKTYGFLHMDALVPTGEVFEWRLLDASTNLPIPGFEHSVAKSVDLGMVDWEAYPSVRLSIHMKSQNGGVPVIHGIHLEGNMVEDFSDDPTGFGWSLQGTSWANGKVSGSGTLESPTINVRSGFGGFDSNSILSANGKMQYSLDGGTNWIDLVDGKQWLSKPSFSVQFRVLSTGGSWNLDTFDVELIRTSVADGLRIDVGMDGVSDWSLEEKSLGRLGIQDRLMDGSMWQTFPSTPSSSAIFTMLLPSAGVDAFEFGVASPGQSMTSPFLSMAVDGQDFMSYPLSTLDDLQVVRLSSTDLNSLNSALSQATPTHGPEGLPMVEVTARIGSSVSSSNVLFGGIFAPYDASLSLQFDSDDPVVIAINSALLSSTPVLGTKEIDLPVRMKSSGAIQLTVVGQTTESSLTPISISVSNVTDTFTPSTDWVEVSSVFDLANLDVTDAESYVKSNGWSVALHLQGQSAQSETRCQMISLPVLGSSVSGCVNQGTSMVWTMDGADGEIKMLGSGSLLQVDHRFKFTQQWDDEESLSVSVSLLSPSGPMLPVSTNFGLGTSKGVENDVELIDWSIVNENGVHSLLDMPYLHPGEDVIVEVNLGFENVHMSPSPRTGSTLVRFLVDGSEVQSSSIIIDGTVQFPWTIPTGKQSIDLEIDVSALVGQAIVYAVPNSVTFEFDTVDPELISVSVSEFDHVDASPSTEIDFVIADRPVLPSHAEAHVWRSWVDDSNQDGEMQLDEVLSHPLELPVNLTYLQGIYSLDLDTSSAFTGSYFSGWLDVADPAGNQMLGSGTLEEPLFNVQVNNDGTPQLGSSVASWSHGDSSWLHPGESNVLYLPLWDPNGITDISFVELDLAGNQNNPVVLQWNSSTQKCTSFEIYLDIESCQLIPSQPGNLFSSEGILQVNFSISWGFDPDVSLTRIPTVHVQDHRGQSNTLTVPDLSWQFSGEVDVDPQTLKFVIDGEVVDTLGTWVKPREDILVHGNLTWFRSSREVMQPTELKIKVGTSEEVVESVNGSFTQVITSPLTPGSYGMFTSLYNPSNGAIDRTPISAPAWFIVDDKMPELVGVPSPQNEILLLESTWQNLQFEVLISEKDRLHEDSLVIHWSVHPEGIGQSSLSVLNGSESLSVVGGRAFGEEILCAANLNLDELLTSDMKDDALEIRIWVTGRDMAGHEIDPRYNDIDSPLAVWLLEQRIAEYSFGTPEMKPNKDLAAGEPISLGVTITNLGLADGDAQIFVELVESNGARTRIDARGIQIEAGDTYVYSKEWIPDRAGTMWIEYQIINGPSAQTSTMYVDEASSDGLFSSIAAVNPVLLVIIFLLSTALVGLLIFGLKAPQPTSLNARQRQQMAKPLPRISQSVAQQPAQPKQAVSGPYGAPQQVASPGENPYK